MLYRLLADLVIVIHCVVACFVRRFPVPAATLARIVTRPARYLGQRCIHQGLDVSVDTVGESVQESSRRAGVRWRFFGSLLQDKWSSAGRSANQERAPD